MLEAALDLIAEGGLTRATLARIGERAGYSRGLADYHFDSKSALVRQVVLLVARRWAQGLAARNLHELRGIDALATVVDLYMAQLEEDPREFQVLYVLTGESVSIAPDIKAHIAHHDELFRRHLQGWIIEAKDDGTIRADVETVAASVLIEGLLRGVAYQWLLSPSAFRPTAMTPLLLDTLLSSLGRPSGIMSHVLRASRDI